MSQDALLYTAVIEDDSPEAKGRIWRWIVFATLALLLHALFTLLTPWLAPPQPRAPVQVQTVDPSKLEQIRKQWRDQKSLLLGQENKPRSDTAPKDARYQSDRNIRVEKEQRARQTSVVPRPQQAPTAQEQQKSEPRTDPQFLKRLGVPFKLGSRSTPERANTTPRSAQAGGDQAIMDPRLAQGSENMLNAQESVYYSFYARLYEAIAPNWQSHVRSVASRQRPPMGDYTTVAYVVFDSHGNLLRVEIVESSGLPAIDEAVPFSWKRIGKFPNPPRDLVDAQGEVKTVWTFTLNVGPGNGLYIAPPERIE